VTGLNGASKGIAAGSSNLIYGNTITKGFRNGYYSGGNGSIIAKNNITDNGGDAFIDGSNNIFCGNIITNSGGINVFVGNYQENQNNTFYANYVANNNVGASIGGQNLLYHNNFINNTHQTYTPIQGVDYLRWGVNNSWDNSKEGNYWSNCNGSDANNDGIGDTPYVIDTNSSDHYPLMALFDISSVTVPLPEWASPSAAPTTSPSPSPSPAPTLTPSPTQSPSPPLPTTNPSPTTQNSATPTKVNSNLQANTYWIAAVATALIIIVAAATLMLRKRKRNKS
jgi:hypothetical protein